MNKTRRTLWSFKLLAALVLLLPVLGCGKPAEQPDDGETAIGLSLRRAQRGDFRLGEVADAAFTLTNDFPKAVVVMSITPVANTGEEPIILSSSVVGSVAKLDAEDAYSFNSLDQRSTQLPFHAGLLLPGQAVTVLCTYRPLARKETFRVEYYAAEKDYDEDAGPLFPLKTYAQAGGDTASAIRSKYVPFSPKNWDALCDRIRHVRPPGPGVPPRAVLIPDLPAKGESALVEIEVTYEADGFALEDAIKTAARIESAKPDEITLAYSTAFGEYVVFDKTSAWLLASKDEKERGELLPLFPPIMLKDVDSLDLIRVQVGDKQEGFGPERREAPRKLWETYQVYYGDGMYTRGEFVELKKDDVIHFLRKVDKRGLTLGIHHYYFRDRYYTLEGQEEGDD